MPIARTEQSLQTVETLLQLDSLQSSTKFRVPAGEHVHIANSLPVRIVLISVSQSTAMPKSTMPQV
jgi:hypothetical protein